MDDLTRIKGIGKATAAKLVAAGFDTFEKLAHDAVAGRDGVEVAWIAEAAQLLHENSEGGGAGSAPVPATDAVADAAVVKSEAEKPAAEDKPAVEAAAGTNTTPSEKGGGDVPDAGVSALPLEEPRALAAWKALEALGELALSQLYPLTGAALRSWAENLGSIEEADVGPTIRIASKRDGFRRGGVAHPRGPVDHPAMAFTPAELELLLAEPNLVVELV